jgi:hypothetical protein
MMDMPELEPGSVEGMGMHPWIGKSRRMLVGYWEGTSKMRTVWSAPTKLGTQPGGIGLFSEPPAVGVVCEWWQEKPNKADVRWQQPKRVHIDRIDDIVQRVFTSLV